MAELEQQKPEVLLVTQQTHDFGIIVRALIGTEHRGVVSRFDLEQVLRWMQHEGTSVLVGRVNEVDLEGRCYTVCIDRDEPNTDITFDNAPDIWTDWHWTGAPLLDSSDDDRRLDISLKVALAELRRNGSMNRQTLLEHLNIVMQLAKWDVCRETQQQLNEMRKLIGQHPDSCIRDLAPKLRHTFTAIGSTKRTREFQDIYFQQLSQSEEAERMRQQWCDIHKSQLKSIKQWQLFAIQQLEAIDSCLMQLPADLCYQKEQFGTLMHRLLYLNIPRQKLVMLLSALVLRQQLRNWLEMTEEEAECLVDDTEQQLVRQLKPIFFGNSDRAREFLTLIKNKNTTDITSTVNAWVRDRLICAIYCHRPLWSVLHSAGIYKASESNWNMYLDIRKSWC